MRTLVTAELKQRVRGRRWWILLGLWTLLLAGLVALVRAGMRSAIRAGLESPDVIGPIMFGALALFVLGLAALVVPALTATSINTERDRGTLAVMQATLFSPLQIAGAKFVASLVAALAFLAATVPIAAWTFMEGDVGVGRVAAVYVVLAVMFALFLAIGLASSAVIRRPVLSVVVAYGAVALLTVGSPILFALAMATAPEQTIRGNDFVTTAREVGWRWVILAPDPFVILADSAPRSGSRIGDPLDAIREGAQSMIRSGFGFGGSPRATKPLWPVGLAIDAAVAALGLYLAVVRLRVPAHRLSPGQRIA